MLWDFEKAETELWKEPPEPLLDEIAERLMKDVSLWEGSVNHNSRKFKAENVDAERSHPNVDYCNESIKKVYHRLFDEALQRYNDK